MFRLILLVYAAMVGLCASAVADAQQNAFDLVGPTIAVSVTRGGATLPIARVPGLQAGDQLTGRAELPADKSARYLLVVGFLRGAATPPPKNWFVQTKTWKRGKKTLTVTVPDGAEQAIALLVPAAGGGFDAVVDAIRERPGVFVRASQDLYQASLDRSRLEAFVTSIARIEEKSPEDLDAASPVLAGALALRLNAECLTRQRALRAACLTQNRESLVLQASSNGQSVGDRLIGAPTDVAYRIAATREGGAGFYSPYIGLARDLVRLFGAFRTASYQYLPALTVGHDDALQLRLNTPPSFANPRSVLVAALPPIGSVSRPSWRAGGKGGLCLARSELVLPIENAPLLYATEYASDLSLGLQMADGRKIDLPVTADAERGGLLVRRDETAGAVRGQVASASLQGRWGFDRFDGLSFPVQAGASAGWTPRPDTSVIVGRDHPLVLRGGASACVDRLTLRSEDGELSKVEFTATGPDEITATLPLKRVGAGPLTLLVSEAGGAAPTALDLVAEAEPSRLDSFVVHAGDAEGVLFGARLDQIADVRLHGVRFAPGELVRGENGDQLALSSGKARTDVPPGTPGEAVVSLRDGRTAKVLARIAPGRPDVALISRSVQAQPQTGGLLITLPEATMTPDALLTFSVRARTGGLQTSDVIEVATEEGSARALLTVASGGLQRVGEDLAIATLRPLEALGVAVAGKMRFRLLRGSVRSDWHPLADVVRLPALGRLSCPADGKECILSGSRLFLLAEIADGPDFARSQMVPSGFLGAQLALPRPTGSVLYLRLRDVPDVVAQVALRRSDQVSER